MNMSTSVFAAFAAAAMFLLPALGAHAERADAVRSKVVAYVPNWIDLTAFVKTIDYAKITHINLAFENPADAEGTLSFDKGNDVLIASARAHHIPILLSIGGGTASSNAILLARYADLLTDAKRTGFVVKLAAYLDEHRFDGLDVDLEGPTIDNNYGAFIRDLSAVLKPKRKLLTAAVSRGYGGDKIPDSVFAGFDFVNIMAYDATGNWNPNVPGPHSTLEYAKSNVDYWLKRGLPKAKAILGVPFYGYGFGDAFRNGDYAYSEIVSTYPGAENGDQAGKTIWYNGLPTMRAKAEYVKVQGLGGVMIWDLNSDAPGDKSLLAALAKVLLH